VHERRTGTGAAVPKEHQWTLMGTLRVTELLLVGWRIESVGSEKHHGVDLASLVVEDGQSSRPSGVCQNATGYDNLMPGRDNSILAVCRLIFDGTFIVRPGLNGGRALIFERDV